jgi:ATPase subunit of ABC transporter with duplicated ATPase domains
VSSSSATTATLVARDVSKSFGPKTVLHRVSLTIAPGSRIGVVAPNGTGKTTLLRILAGLDLPDGGRVELLPPTATVGYLPQEPDRVDAETLVEFLGRRTGVTVATAALESAAAALASGSDEVDDAYAHALDRYLALGAADFDARVGEVFADLGIEPRLAGVPMTALSGGQAARAGLAAILLARFDVFLLDEPTNDLDFAGLERLERFVVELPAGAVIVSHDRSFLERTIEEVLELDEQSHTATQYRGGWSAFLGERATARRHAEEAYATFTEQRDALTSRAQRERQWSQQGVAKVRKSGETDKYIRAFKTNSSEHVAARAKRTDRMLERLQEVDKPWEGWQLQFEIGVAERSGSDVASLDGVMVDRGEFRLGPIDLHVVAGERLAIVGSNGSGKTTLLDVLLGRITPAVGTRRLGPGVQLGTLDQTRGRFLATSCLLDAFVAETALTNSEARSLLAKFGLLGEHVLRAPSTLSPGERTRLELALLMARGVNCLVLDEPTNHLDLPAIEQLEQALDRFTGTLVVVTHDRRLLDGLRLTRQVELRDGTIADATTGSGEEQVGDAVVVPGRGAEERFGEGGAPQEQLQVVFPRVADAAVNLDRVLQDPVRCFRGRCLGAAAGACALGIVGIDGHGRVLRRRGGALARERHVGKLVLDGLERPDRPVELHPFLGIRQRHIEHSPASADGLGRDRDVGPVDPGSEHRRIDREPIAGFGNDCKDPPGRVGRVDRGDPTRRCRDDAYRRSGVDDGDVRREVCIGHEHLARFAVGDRHALGATDRDGPDDRSVEGLVEIGMIDGGEQWCEQCNAREERAGRRHVSERVEEQAQVGAIAAAERREAA